MGRHGGCAAVRTAECNEGIPKPKASRSSIPSHYVFLHAIYTPLASFLATAAAIDGYHTGLVLAYGYADTWAQVFDNRVERAQARPSRRSDLRPLRASPRREPKHARGPISSQQQSNTKCIILKLATRTQMHYAGAFCCAICAAGLVVLNGARRAARGVGLKDFI